MKTKLIIVLAAVAMLFTACGKDKDPEVGNNQLIYNGVIYNVTSHYDPGYAMYYYSADAITENDTVIPKFSFFGEGYYESMNTSIDLTKGPIEDLSGYWIVMTWNDQSHPDFYAGNQNGNMVCGFDGVDYDYASPFKSGTMTITKDDKAFTLHIAGVMRNDDTMALKLYVPFK